MQKDYVFNRQEAADAMKVSLPVLDAYLKRQYNPLPAITNGRRVLIPVKGFEHWLEEEAMRCMEETRRKKASDDNIDFILPKEQDQ